MTLTNKEQKAIDTILGYSNLSDDSSTVWAQPEDLIVNGYSKHEAAGLWSSLLDKGALEEDEKRTKAEGGDLFVLGWDVLPKWKQIEINEEYSYSEPRAITATRNTPECDRY